MKLTIRRNQGDARDVKLVRLAVPFMLKRLLRAELVKQVSLHVSFTRLPHDFGDIGIEEAPKFKLRLHHETDTLLMLVTLAHELAHLAQVMDGRLKIKKIKGLHVWHWENKPYGDTPYEDGTSALPWEDDAVELETDLACQFFAHYVTLLNPA